LRANRIRFSRARERLSKKVFQRREEELDRLKFFIEKDLEGYSEEEIEELWYDKNIRFIESTGTSLN